MLVVSVSDLQLATALSHMSEFEIAHPDNDEIVANIIYQLGIDTEFPWVYTVNRHRNMQNQDLVGLRIVGEVRCDAEFRDSKLAGITERLVISSYLDPTCMEEIAELAYKVRSFDEYLNDSDSLDWDESRAIFPEDQYEPDYVEQEQNIESMKKILESIRGCVYNDAGALKMMSEYKKGK